MSSSISASGVFHGRARKPSRSTAGLTPAWTNSVWPDRQFVSRLPSQTKNPVRQRDADDGQELFGAGRLHLEAGELPDHGAAAVAQPALQRLDRIVPRRMKIEREPHHRLVVAHEPDPRVRADQGAGADREVDCPEAVGTAVHEVAEKEEDARFPSPRLERRLVEQGLEQVGPAVKSPMANTSVSGAIARGKTKVCRSTTAAMDSPSTATRREHCTSGAAR